MCILVTYKCNIPLTERTLDDLDVLVVTSTSKAVILQYKSFTAATIEGALSVDTVVFTPSIGYSTLVDICNNENSSLTVESWKQTKIRCILIKYKTLP